MKCDGENCDGIKALQKCSKCKAVYYCDVNCQRSHWKQHRSDCVGICKTIADSIKVKNDMEMIANENKHSIGEDCAICLTSVADIKSVMQLPCHHVFCVECSLKVANPTDRSIPKCPLCRENINESLYQHQYRNSAKYTNIARSFPENSTARIHYCDLAANELDKLDLNE